MRASTALVAVIVLSVGGCTVTPGPVTSMPPLGYRQIVRNDGFVGKLRGDAAFGSLEISGLQKTRLGEPGDWRTCLRTTHAGKTVYYAIFFVGDVIENVRQSVAIDRCEQEEKFLPLLPPTPKTKSKQEKRPG